MGQEVVVQNPLIKKWIRSYGFSQNKFIAHKIFAPKDISTKDAEYVVFDQAQKANRIEHVEVDGNSEAVTVKFEYSTKEIVSKTIAVKTFISSTDQKNMVDPVLSEHEKGMLLALNNILLTKMEYDASNLVKTTSIYPTENIETLLEAAQYDQDGVDPFVEIANDAQVVADNGDNPNLVVLGGKTFTKIKGNTVTKDWLGSNGDRVFKVANLANIVSDGVTLDIGPNQVLIGNALYNTSKTNTPSNTYFWDKMTVVAYNNPDSQNMLFQKTFAQLFYPTGNKDIKIYKWTEDGKRGGYWLELERKYSFNVIDARCAKVRLNVHGD